MVNEDCLARLNKALCAALKRNGLEGAPLKVVQWLDNIGIVEVPKAIANANSAALDAVADELSSHPDVEKMFDESRGLFLRGAEVREIDLFVRKGLWVRTADDDAKAKREIDAYVEGTPEYEKRLAKIDADMRRFYKDYIIPVPPPPKSFSTEVFLVLRYDAYDAIKAGAKTTEFRDYNEYYVAKLLSHPIKTVRFQRGYGSRGGAKPEQMVWSVKAVSLYDEGTRKECRPGEEPEGFLASHITIDLDRRIRYG